jgi:endonuclease/exonuclease/phosphatase (EEP) superfamily protein YafD
VGRIFRIIAGIGSLLVAAGAIATAVAGFGGRDDPKLDVLNHFAPIWLIAGLAALVFALWPTRGWLRRAAVAVACLAVALNGARVVPEFAARFASRTPVTAERLKLIQFNAYARNETPQRSVDWLIAQQADVVVIEEGEGLPRAEYRRLRTDYPYCSGCSASDEGSNVILSKRRPLAEARFKDVDGFSSANGGWSRFAGPGGDYTVVGVHFTWPWLPTAAAQHAGLARFIASQPRDRLILAGDFNMTPWSYGLRRMDAALGLERLTRGQGSWPAAGYHKIPDLPVLPLPYIAIDQVYAGGGWRAVRVARGPSIGSDHNPIVVELAARRP